LREEENEVNWNSKYPEMKRLFLHAGLLFLSISFFSTCTSPQKNDERIDILILSGRNNHDWKQTTPVLQRTFEESGYFKVDVTNQPDTLDFEKLRGYDVVVNNWNSWPENDLRWPETTEEGLLKFIEQGGGLVFFHASTSVFYDWPGFKKISTGAWIDSTWHGELCPVKVTIDDRDHPITNGMAGFYIFDELWFNAEQNDAFHVMGSATRKNDEGNESDSQPAVFVSDYGKGRICQNRAELRFPDPYPEGHRMGSYFGCYHTSATGVAIQATRGGPGIHLV